MTFVVDASVAAAWVLPDERSNDADAVLAFVGIDGAVTPSLLWYELRNILIMAARGGRLPGREAAGALGRLRRLPIESVDMTLSDDAGVSELAERHRVSVYDAHISRWHGDAKFRSPPRTRNSFGPRGAQGWRCSIRVNADRTFPRSAEVKFPTLAGPAIDRAQ